MRIIFKVEDKIYCKGNNSYGVITYKKDHELNVLWDDGSVDTFYPRDVYIDRIINTGEKVCVLDLSKEIRADEN